MQRSRLDDHPITEAARSSAPRPPAEVLDFARLRAIVLEAGANDVRVVRATHPDLAGELASLRSAPPLPR